MDGGIQSLQGVQYGPICVLCAAVALVTVGHLGLLCASMLWQRFHLAIHLSFVEVIAVTYAHWCIHHELILAILKDIITSCPVFLTILQDLTVGCVSFVEGWVMSTDCPVRQWSLQRARAKQSEDLGRVWDLIHKNGSLKVLKVRATWRDIFLGMHFINSFERWSKPWMIDSLCVWS